jgi:hypothetical protein
MENSANRLLTLQLFKNSIGTQEKLRLNLHSLSVLLEYWRITLSHVFLGMRVEKRQNDTEVGIGMSSQEESKFLVLIWFFCHTGQAERFA